ncbi:right-handed parallel beta-helix repeat-containing protein [Methanobrevibacter sp.]
MNKKIILFLLILVCVCSISQVSATDDVDVVAIDESGDIEMQIEEINEFDESLVGINPDNENKLTNESNNYRSIQNQIDDAEEGDTIYLEGEYICDYLINVNKPVNIIGNGTGATIRYNVTGEVLTPFFYINDTAPNVVLENIKFIGGQFLWGGAITWAGDNGCIKNCEFTNNRAIGDNAIGGAITVLANNINITDCIFEGNTADKYGGAVLLNGTVGIISNCVFRDNSATKPKGYGGAIIIYGKDFLVKDSNFTNNYVSDYGGAIAVLVGDNNTIINCNFNNNYVQNEGNESEYQGGGAIFDACKGLTVEKCNFTNNKAEKSFGGAISLADNTVVKNSYFKDNNALLGNDLKGSFNNISGNHFVIDFEETVLEACDLNINADDPTIPRELIIFDYLNQTNFIDKIKHDSIVKFSAGLIFAYGASGSIYVTVEGGSVGKIMVVNHPEARISFVNNLLTVSNLAVGKYTLRVTTNPDENHTSVDGDLSVTVNKATAVIKASKLTVALKSSSVWTIKIVDSRNNKPVANMKVTLKVYTGKKFKTVTLTTNSKGEATYKTKSLSSGTHKVIVSASHAGYNLNSLSSSISVVKQTPLKFKLNLKSSDNGGALISYLLLNKKTKKGINGVKLKVLIYTGKTYKTYTLKTKKVKGKKKTYSNGAFGFSTNAFSAGTHKVVIKPVSIKYKGSVTTSIKIKKAATKKLKYFRKV